MIKKILILSTGIDDAQLDIIKNHSQNDIYFTSYKFLVFTISQTNVSIYDSRNKHALEDYDLIYLKQYSSETSACIIYLNSKGVSYFNKDLGTNSISDKLGQYVKLSLGGYLIPDTVYGSHDCLKQLGKELEYPMILKCIKSSMGRNNFLVKDHAELCSTLDLNKKGTFVIQKFINNTFDYRILILGNKLGTALKRIRQNKDDHRNNTALGALEVEVTTPSEELIDLSINVSKHLNKEIAGVDIILDDITGNYYVIEVNSKPFFTNDITVSSEVPQFTKYIDSLVA